MFVFSYVSERIILVMQGRLSAFDAIHGIIRRLELPSIPYSENAMKKFMNNALLKEVTKSDPILDKRKGSHPPLGELATQ